MFIRLLTFLLVIFGIFIWAHITPCVFACAAFGLVFGFAEPNKPRRRNRRLCRIKYPRYY